MNKKSWIILAIVAVIAVAGIVGFIVEKGKVDSLSAQVKQLEADVKTAQEDLANAKAEAAAAAEAKAAAEAEAAAAAEAAAKAAFVQAESYEPEERVFDGGEIVLEKAAVGGGSVTTDVYAGIEGKDYTDEKVYTYNDYTSGIGSSMLWDPLAWETSDDSAIVDYITTGFYTFKLNSDKTGYSVVPELAAEMPVDVTAEYAGTYGISEGETGKAWRIALNQDATWENGEKITADDYVYSVQQLLNPKMLNRRADSYYAGTWQLVNAKNYLYAGGATYELITGSEPAGTELYLDMSFWGLVGCPDAEGNACPQYVLITDETLYRDTAVEDETNAEAWVSAKYVYDNYLADGAPYAAYATSYVYTYQKPMTYELITGAEEEGTPLFLDMDFWGLVGCADAEGNACPQYVSITDETLYRDTAVEESDAEAWVSAKYVYDNYLADGAPYAAYASSYVYTQQEAKAVTWDEVGFKKIDDYTIDFILVNPVEEAAFYVPYNLSSSYLVYKPLYEACKSFFDADGKQVETEEDASTVTTTYCRTLETTISYGPYKLTAFELDKEYTLSRNEEWYGYRDGKHLGQYQTDAIKVTVIAEHATAMLAFEKGEIDGISLQSEDLTKYGTSQYIHYGPDNGYTTKLSFNLDYNKLLSRGTNSQILVIDEFRQAFAYCYDRKEFATAYTAAGTAGFGLLNELYCYDPFTGASYRDNDYAKAGLLKVFDVTWGEGGDYDTLDEAYEALTGYDMEKAQALMKVAYDKSIAAGVYDGVSDISIEFRVYKSDDIYVKMFTYLNDHLQTACVGSGFEGKVSLKMVVDDDYYNTNYSGGADMIFTTWGGASMQPFTILYECYCDACDGSGQQMEYNYDTSKITVSFTINGEVIADSLQNWALWADGGDASDIIAKLGKFADYSYDTRCAIYSQLEAAFLNWFPTTAVYYRNSASLSSQKYNMPVDSYLNLIGFGGIEYEYYTYNYDDAEWADYIANNELVY